MQRVLPSLNIVFAASGLTLAPSKVLICTTEFQTRLAAHSVVESSIVKFPGLAFEVTQAILKVTRLSCRRRTLAAKCRASTL